MDVRVEINFPPQTVQPQPLKYIGWRCLHVGEGGYYNPPRMPEVRPSKNIPSTAMTEAMQLLSYEVMRRNPNVTTETWRNMHGIGLAFCNLNGFNEPGEPKRDYVNGWDLDAVDQNGNPALPKLDKAIICGGMFIRGEVINGNLVCHPGIHGIDATKAMPTADEVYEKNWYYTAVTWSGAKPYNFPQGKGLPIVMPYFLKQSAVYPLNWFTKWESNELPDPLTMYLTM